MSEAPSSGGSVWRTPADMEPAQGAAVREALVARIEKAQGHINASERRLWNDTDRGRWSADQAKARIAEVWLWLDRAPDEVAQLEPYLDRDATAQRLKTFADIAKPERLSDAWNEVLAAEEAIRVEPFPVLSSHDLSQTERAALNAGLARKHRYLTALDDLLVAVEDAVADRFLALGIGDWLTVHDLTPRRGGWPRSWPRSDDVHAPNDRMEARVIARRGLTARVFAPVAALTDIGESIRDYRLGAAGLERIEGPSAHAVAAPGYYWLARAWDRLRDCRHAAQADWAWFGTCRDLLLGALDAAAKAWWATFDAGVRSVSWQNPETHHVRALEGRVPAEIGGPLIGCVSAVERLSGWRGGGLSQDSDAERLRELKGAIPLAEAALLALERAIEPHVDLAVNDWVVLVDSSCARITDRHGLRLALISREGVALEAQMFRSMVWRIAPELVDSGHFRSGPSLAHSGESQMDESQQQRAGDAARRAGDALGKAERAMDSDRHTDLTLLFRSMRSALDWAIECRLRADGHDPGLSGQTEDRFLQLAPDELREEYRRVSGGIAPLAKALFDRIGTARVAEISPKAPALAEWREDMLAWLADARTLVRELTEVEALRLPPGGRRVERGALRGRLDTLVPCLLLVQDGGRVRRWRRGGDLAGMFTFGEPTDRGGALICRGLILPIALCRDASLRERLRHFARLLERPLDRLSPTAMRDRRSELRGWLESQDLGCMQLVDREPVGRWTRIALNPAIFATVLHACDYVTALWDDEDVSARIEAHEPLRWRRHGDLLEWAAMDDGDDAQISPFKLFVVNDLTACRDFFRGARERHHMVRPLEYWARHTVPDPAVRQEDVAVRFEQSGYGWVDLHLTFGNGPSIEILLSHVYDPLMSMLEWLQAAATGELPIAFDIDEEGTVKRLVAHAFGADRLLIVVREEWEEIEHGSAVVDRDRFLSAFRDALNEFLQERFDVEKWVFHEEDDVRAQYLDELLAHAFLTNVRRVH